MSQSYGAGEMSSSSEMSKAPSPSMSATQIPDLLKIGSIPTDTQMDVDSDILDPVVQNDTFIRFVLQNKGLLHSHSKIQVGFTSATDVSTLPLNVGIAALFQRATLRVGNQTICEIDDFAHFTAYRGLFMSGESMKERLPYLTGQNLAKRVSYTDEGEAWSSATPPLATATEFGGGGSNYQARGLVIDNGLEMRVAPGVYNGALKGNLRTPSWSELKNDGAVFDDKPTWQFALDDLFPFLKTNQLPLYMMKEQIQLEFVLHSSTSGRRSISSFNGVESPVLSLDSSKTKMIADYIYYPQEMMMSYASANPNLQFQYVDYRLSKLSVDPDTTGQQIRNLGGAGRIVSKIVWGMSSDTKKANTSLLNFYNSQGLGRTAGIDTMPPIAPSGATAAYTQGAFTQNVKLNSGFLYPIDVSNVARSFHNVVQAEGLTPYTTREEYSNEGVSLPSYKTISGTTAAGDGFAMSTLAAQSFWNAVRINSGERVNSRGLELYFQLNALPAGQTYTLRAYLETIKLATLKNGMVSTFLA